MAKQKSPPLPTTPRIPGRFVQRTFTARYSKVNECSEREAVAAFERLLSTGKISRVCDAGLEGTQEVAVFMFQNAIE